MAKKMPVHIKNNFIYRRVHNLIWNEDNNAAFVVIGNTGKGKSSLGLKLCEDLDPSFHVGRIVYSVKDFIKLVYHGDEFGQLKAGQAILFDEVVTDEGAQSRNFMSKTNKFMESVIATYRAKRLIVVFCFPKLTQLDVNVRNVGITGLFEMLRIDRKHKKALARFQWQELSARSGDSLNPYPRIKSGGVWKRVQGIWFDKPSDELWGEYRKKKMEFLNKLGDKYYREMMDREEQELAKKEKKKKLSFNEVLDAVRSRFSEFTVGSKVEPVLVRSKLNCGMRNAEQVARFFNKSQKVKQFAIPNTKNTSL